MKFKHLLFAAALFSVTPLFYACSDDDNEVEIPRDPEEDPDSQPNTNPEATIPTTATGVYVCNAGNDGNNINGSLSFIDFATNKVTNNLFSTVNKRSLGSTVQDAIVYGSKMYIAVYKSNVIEVVDKNTAKSIKQIIPTASQGTEPRDVVAANGKVYVSMFDGYVSRIDTTTCTIDATLKVGPNPEEMTIANGFLYVTNSDGMNYGDGYKNGKSVSKIGLKTFTEAKRIPVMINPNKICATKDGNVYVISQGNYNNILPTVQKINAMNEVTEVAKANLMAVKDNTLYLINAPYGVKEITYMSIDTQTGKENKNLIDQPVDSPCSIVVNPFTGNIYISSYNMVGGYASYTTDGYVNEYSAAGKFIRKYDVGVGPCGLNFLLK